ncbi:AMIN-like domain-containing (lipo)protein [Corynebacterium doosanense]|uniref:AMIN-like domain-containing protein n=1 Tax=Corynebacterium doosanense CAU 212 = DSM 45436 TaxID=558173 RepID=A0A097IGN9_9CORY|nr:AMIN domain-containing protein [Corynebacterium doosanense]AIT61323.1 hypothetical protein CDOO_08660 [Corynebacterium doosanense CAU 212 = DSM 45436]
MTLTALGSHRTLSLTAAAALAALTLAACGPEEDTNNTSSAPQTTTMTSSPAKSTPATTTEVVTETGAPADDTVQQSLGAQGTTDTSNQQPVGEWDLSIVDVRAGQHSGFDRVVIEFAGTGTPGWFASYTDEPRQQASGFPIEYQGGTAIDLMANGVALPAGPDSTFPVGPTGAAGGAVTGVSHNGIFEGQAQFVIGLDGEPRPYTVTTLENPPRLVVDIQN